MSQKRHNLNSSGGRLQYFRKRKKLNQDELASKIGTTRQNVSFWETGLREIPATYHKDICRELEIDISDLIPETSVTDHAIADELGLSYSSIDILKLINKSTDREPVAAINCLLSYDEGLNILRYVYSYFFANFERPFIDGKNDVRKYLDFENEKGAVDGGVTMPLSMFRFGLVEIIGRLLEDIRQKMPGTAYNREVEEYERVAAGTKTELARLREHKKLK